MLQGSRCSNTSLCSEVSEAGSEEHYQWAQVAGTSQAFSCVPLWDQ